LTKAGCKKVFEDKVTGRRAERPGLTKAQEALREGDTLVVWKLDRLGRSVKNLVDLVEELHKQGVQLKSLTDAINTRTSSGRFFFHMMASLAQMERELTIERSRPRSCPSARPQRWPETANDRQQDQISQKASRERSTTSRCDQ
jgi:DNA invertase Pin-like site-specific DNA recombinase